MTYNLQYMAIYKELLALQPMIDVALKRILDIAGACVGLVLFAPVMLGTALAIRLQMGSPVLFRQQRPGRFGKPFMLYKFRTMRDARDKQGNLLPDEKRLTPLGQFLRRTSLDELPELFNVLVGDMSLVGPRPLLMKYLPYYTSQENLRHRVRPGITGWAQINGRNDLPWDRRLALDIWYVEHQSLRLDAAIILKTIVSVFKREGVVINPRGVMLDLDEERRAISEKV